MSRIGFAIVGLGGIAETHAKAIASIEGASLVAVCSRSLAKAREFASRHGGIKYYDEVEYLLENPDVDIVVVTTPCGEHLRPVELALKAGRHVIVEKPLEITEERIKHLSRIAEEEGVYLTCIFQSRYMPAIEEIRSAIKENRFGKITLVNVELKSLRTQSYYDAIPWRGSKKIAGGGVLINQGIHSIDLMLYLVGNPIEAIGYIDNLGHENIDVEDSAAAILKMENGALCTIEATIASFPGEARRVEINGTKGTLVLEDDAIVKWEFAEKRDGDDSILERYSKENSLPPTSDPTVVDVRYFIAEYKDFIDSIAHGKEQRITPKEALRSIKTIEAIYKSSQEHRPIEIKWEQ